MVLVVVLPSIWTSLLVDGERREDRTGEGERENLADLLLASTANAYSRVEQGDRVIKWWWLAAQTMVVTVPFSVSECKLMTKTWPVSDPTRNLRCQTVSVKAIDFPLT